MSLSNRPPEFAPLELIAESWGIVVANAATLVGGALVMIVIATAASSVPLGALIVQGPLLFGLYSAALIAVRGGKPPFEEVFSGFKVFIPAFVAGLLISIIEVVGGLLCIVPGLIATVLFLPTFLYMKDESLDFWPAMERSRLVVWNNFFQWAILGLALFGLNLLGALACCIGLVFTSAMSFVVIAKAYELERAAEGGMAFKDITPPAA